MDRSRDGVHLGRAAFLIWLAFAVAGCSSTRAPGEPLPFHVGLLPLRVQSDVATDPSEAGSGELYLELDRAQLVEDLRAALRNEAFVKVSVLEETTGAADEVSAAGSGVALAGFAEGDVLDLAEEAGVDVLLRPTLDFDPLIRTRINDKFWLNLPIFFVTGPLSWLVNDRTYEVDARLQAEFFDMTGGRDALAERFEIIPIPIQAEFQDLDLDLLDRAGSNVPTYLFSVVIPPGLLARRGQSVDSRVESATRAGLVEDLIVKFDAERSAFLENDLANFVLVPGSLRLRRTEGDQAFLEAAFETADGGGIRSYSVFLGDTLVRRGDLSQTVDPDGLVWVRGTIPLSADADAVRLLVRDNTGGARSYTLLVPPAVEPVSAPAGAAAD